jgi:hypothetical protein
VGYFRGEWQASAGLPAFSLSTRQTIQQINHVPELPPADQPAVSQFQVLDAYVGLAFSNWQLTFGRQSLWWGPGDGGPLIFGDNAAPINMFRINRVTPFKLPSILGWLGPLRLEFFLGQLEGHQFIGGQGGVAGSFLHTIHPQPAIHGERFTFKPTRNFEFGFSRTGIFAGQGVPFTLHTFGKSFFGLGNGVPGTTSDPGDRRSGMDWTYRVPMLRDWVTFYGDVFIFRICHISQNLICALRVSTPMCRPEERSAAGFSTLTPDIWMATRTMDSCSRAGSVDKDRVPRARQTIGSPREIDYSLIIDIRKSATSLCPTGAP